ncbi:HAD-IIIA family hydrolase [Kribbella deserti]|uniref:D,D-heptose 1,7-bisphosphate phosphatase n=1 Tax=Kribbella deserti TaxID=1926257 RepID=A0ABV6QSB9_9ACTN
MSYAVVIPTVGRATLTELLADLATQPNQPDEIVVVDDRRGGEPLDLGSEIRVLRGGGRGPAAARNRGWRATSSSADWVVFLDDDIRLSPDWSRDLADDLRVPDSVAGVQGRIVVPLDEGRAPTDWERSTAGLENARWATADMAYRRDALRRADGFDERFPRAYREDAELALRIRRQGGDLRQGKRHVLHPARAEGYWVSVRVQRGNADDALMKAVHGRNWRGLAECPPGRFRWHLLTVLAGCTAAGGAVAGRRRLAVGAAGAWFALTVDFARRRIAPGPRTRDEISRMSVTSVVIPPVASWHRLRGWWRHRGATAWPGPVRAVLFDRDGTLVQDVPYNGDPAKVAPMPGASDAIRRLRKAGIKVGVVTNQSGVGRGLLTAEQVAAVNQRIDAELGPFETWQICPHTADDGCACRKPAAGMVLAAAEDLGVRPQEVVVIGDIGTDVQAAEAAGARSVLVPTGVTKRDEIDAAPVVRQNLAEAVDLVLERR